MKSLVAVYESYDLVIKSLKTLSEKGFPVKKFSLISQAEEKINHIHLKSSKKAESTELSIGAIAGPIVGILTGVGLFAIPGFGFLFGAGALVGALAGFDFGLVAGGIASILTMIGVSIENHEIYKNHLQQGNYLLIFQGSPEEVETAETAIKETKEAVDVLVY